MARVRGIVGGSLQGSIGNVTFKKSPQGETIASQKAEVVKNPKSYEQMQQRMYMNTVVKAYSALKEICNHSFEGIQLGQKSMSYFIKKNLLGMKSGFDGVSQSRNVGFSRMGLEGAIAPRPFLISEGSIKVTLRFKFTRGEDDPFFKVFNDIYEPNITWKDFSKLTNIKAGDQITIVALRPKSGADWDLSENLEKQQSMNLVYARYLFKTDIPEGTSVFDENSFSEEVLEYSETNGIYLACPLAGSYTFINVELGDDLFIAAAAVIVSRKNGSDWLRSTANLVWAFESANELDKYLEKNVFPSYKAVPRKYLNNATN